MLADCIKKMLESVLTEAVIEPVAILDRFNPTIADAGILNKLAPEPEKDPLSRNNEPVILASPTRLRDPVISAEPV